MDGGDAQEPIRNVQLRAAVGGVMQTRDAQLTGEYTPWLEQLATDVEWVIMRLRKRGSGGRRTE